jgi:hypothetical protein
MTPYRDNALEKERSHTVRRGMYWVLVMFVWTFAWSFLVFKAGEEQRAKGLPFRDRVVEIIREVPPSCVESAFRSDGYIQIVCGGNARVSVQGPWLVCRCGESDFRLDGGSL